MNEEKEPKYISKDQVIADLENPNYNRKLRALRYIELNGWNESIDYLVKMLQREDNKFVVATLVKVIGKYGGLKSIDFLRPFLSHPDSRIRANAVEALGKLKDARIFDMIAPLLCDQDNRVRANATAAIWKFFPDKALWKLKEMIVDPDVWVRNSALYVVGEIEDKRMYEIIETALKDRNRGLKTKAQELKKKLFGKFPELELEREQKPIKEPIEVINRKVEQLQDKVYTERIQALKEIMNRGDSRYVKPLLEYLSREDNEEVLATLIIVLGKLGTKAVVPTLKKFLSHSNHRVRANAVEALSFTGEKSVFADIEKCFDDENHRVRANVAKALWNISFQKCLDKLRRMAVSSNLPERLSAIHALTAIGASQCRILLKQLTMDRDRKVAEEARVNLNKLLEISGEQLIPARKNLFEQIFQKENIKWLIPAGVVVIGLLVWGVFSRNEPVIRESAPLPKYVVDQNLHLITGSKEKYKRIPKEDVAKIKKLMKSALQLENQGKFAAAKAVYLEILNISDRVSLAHNNLGFIYCREGQFNLAREHYEKAIKYDPTNVGALNNLGFVMFKQGNIQDAKNCFHRAQELEPDNVIVLNNLGYIYYADRQFEKARMFLQQAMNLGLSDPVVHNNMAVILIAENKYGEAASELKKVIAGATHLVELKSRAEQTLNVLKKGLP